MPLEERVHLGVLDAGERPVGSGESTCACTAALGHACGAHRAASAGSAWRQQEGSGQRDWRRVVVSRPRNHLAAVNGTPTVMEKPPADVDPVWVVHQKVPSAVSVYW